MFNVDQLSVDDIAQGWRLDEKKAEYCCLYCSVRFQDGVIYPRQDHLLTARRSVEQHVIEEHGSPFEQLLRLEKRFIGLTETQKKLLWMVYQGLGNQAIAQASGIAASTVRAQRFLFREKTRQAKLMLALNKLLDDASADTKIPSSTDNPDSPIHATAAQIDERFAITAADKAGVIKNNVLSLDPLVVKSFPVKEKRKLILLALIAEKFEPDRKYSEKEVNDLIKPIYADYVTIRRYLIEYGYLDRTPRGSAYWVKSNQG